MMGRVLILGGAGFIGSNLVKALLDRGETPSVFDRPEANLGRLSIFQDRLRLYRGSLQELQVLEEIISREDIGTVVHLVSGMLPSSPEGALKGEEEAVIEPTRALLPRLEAHGCRLVFVSSGGAIYGEGGVVPLREDDLPRPTSHYGKAKQMLEEAILMHPMTSERNHLVIRPSNPYGRFQDSSGTQGFIAVATGRVLNGEELTIWGDGSIVRDYLHVDDLVAGMLGLMDHPSSRGIYNLGSGQGHRLTEVLSLIEGLSGLKARVQFAPGRACDPGANVLDIRKTQALIPYAPRSLEEGLRAYVEEVKAHA